LLGAVAVADVAWACKECNERHEDVLSPG